MAQNKTQPTDQPVADFIASIAHPTRARDAAELVGIFTDATGFDPVMWGPSIVGFGRYHYRYATGREGDFLATGFSPRKTSLSIYIMPGYGAFDDILARLGKHKTGKSCLYVNKLDDIDLDVLRELIAAGLRDLSTHWPVEPR